MTDLEIMLSDLEHWRVFLLRARTGSKRAMAPRIHIDHLTAAAVCIGNAVKLITKLTDGNQGATQSSGDNRGSAAQK